MWWTVSEARDVLEAQFVVLNYIVALTVNFKLFKNWSNERNKCSWNFGLHILYESYLINNFFGKELFKKNCF